MDYEKDVGERLKMDDLELIKKKKEAEQKACEELERPKYKPKYKPNRNRTVEGSMSETYGLREGLSFAESSSFAQGSQIDNAQIKADKVSNIAEWCEQMEMLQQDEDNTFHEHINKWVEDVAFLLIELRERDEYIRKLEKVIVNTELNKL